MTAQYLTIERKHRQQAGFLASPSDFTIIAGDTVDADVVRTNPHIILRNDVLHSSTRSLYAPDLKMWSGPALPEAHEF